MMIVKSTRFFSGNGSESNENGSNDTLEWLQFLHFKYDLSYPYSRNVMKLQFLAKKFDQYSTCRSSSFLNSLEGFSKYGFFRIVFVSSWIASSSDVKNS